MGRITLRFDDKIETGIKKLAKEKGMSISEYCREKITGDSTVSNLEELNPITLENRIEKLENEQRELSENVFLMSRFLYNFTVIATDENRAAIAWEAAEKELRAIKERE